MLNVSWICSIVSVLFYQICTEVLYSYILGALLCILKTKLGLARAPNGRIANKVAKLNLGAHARTIFKKLGNLTLFSYVFIDVAK